MYNNIFFVATKRSGHHAVLTWFAKQMTEPVRHYNDLDPVALLNGKIVPLGGISGATYDGKGKQKNIFSFEDIYMDQVEKLERHFRAEVTTIIVLRDIRNTIASLIKSTSKKLLERRLKNSINAWRQYAYAILNGDKNYIIYDKWFKDKEYRQHICTIFNIPFTDEGLNIVPKNANGSSFDQMRYQGKAQQMNVLNRWKAYNKDRVFNEFCTQELKNINEKILCL